MRSHTPAVHAFLHHCRQDGFLGAPEVLGVEGDRELLRFVPGEVPIPPEPPQGRWTVVPSSHLASVGALMRRLHAASALLTPPPGATWQGGSPSPFRGSLISHDDPCVGNVVFQGE